jgi:hypothetical protein
MFNQNRFNFVDFATIVARISWRIMVIFNMSFHIGTTSEIHFGTFYTFEPSLQILGYV